MGDDSKNRDEDEEAADLDRPTPPDARWDNEPTIVGGPHWTDAAATRRRAKQTSSPELSGDGDPPSAPAPRVVPPLVEAELQIRAAVDLDAPVLEIWTRHRVYCVDVRLVCIQVLDAVSRKASLDHSLLGARLVGGQIARPGGADLLFPLPIVDSSAVFQRLREGELRLVETSRVTRVLFRVQRIQAADAARDEIWAAIAGLKPRSPSPA